MKKGDDVAVDDDDDDAVRVIVSWDQVTVALCFEELLGSVVYTSSWPILEVTQFRENVCFKDPFLQIRSAWKLYGWLSVG
jgi:hypothetical protein